MIEWQEIIGSGKEFLRKRGAAVLIVLFLVLEVGAALPAAEQPGAGDMLIRRGPVVAEEPAGVPEAIPARIPKLSEMRGPHIDSGAAMIVVDEPVKASPSRACASLPGDVWRALFLAYLALMVFNLAYGFVRPAARMRIQWFWEILYTLAFIGMWYVWDDCRTAGWFPLAIARMGIFLYAAYLYFFDQRMRNIEK